MFKELDPSRDVYETGRFFDSCQLLAAEHTPLHAGEILALNKDQSKLKALLLKNGIAVPDGSRIDVYNPSIPFVYSGIEHIAGRVELSGKQAEHESLVVFFAFENGQWTPLEYPTYKLQDPCITWIDNKIVLSGVELAHGEEEGTVLYRMAFYAGEDFKHLEPLAKGPWGMKGIRIGELPTGQVAIYTRPQGEKGGLGNIGFTVLDSLADFEKNSELAITSAPLLNTRFLPGEWGGINQIIPISESENVLIGHVAYRDAKKIRHYYPCAFRHNHQTGEISKMKMLATRSNFPDGPAKAEDLVDIVYSAGVIERNREWFLVVGLSDTQSGIIKIDHSIL